MGLILRAFQESVPVRASYDSLTTQDSKNYAKITVFMCSDMPACQALAQKEKLTIISVNQVNNTEDLTDVVLSQNPLEKYGIYKLFLQSINSTPIYKIPSE